MGSVYLTTEAPPDLLKELLERLREPLRKEIREAVQEGLRKPYLTRKDVLEWTGWSERKLSYMLSQRAFPHIRRGRTVLIPTMEFIGYLEEGRIPAASKE